jgi:hypothetical protein
MPSDPATAFLETGIHPHSFTRIVVGSFFFSSGAILMLLTYLFPKYAMLRADGSYSALPLKHPVSIIAMSGFLFLGFHFYLMYYLR